MFELPRSTDNIEVLTSSKAESENRVDNNNFQADQLSWTKGQSTCLQKIRERNEGRQRTKDH